MVGHRMHRVICDDCGKMLVNESIDDNATEIQPHSYLDGDTCFRCGHVKGSVPVPTPDDPTLGADYAGYTTVGGVAVLWNNGQIDAAAEGLTRDAAHPDDWYYCSAGVVHTEVTSVVLYDGAWFYVKDGKLDTTFVGIVDYDGGRFLVAAGRILTEVNGLNQDPDTGAWYYYAGGQIQTQYTGLAQYDGAWFYIVEGKLAEDFSGEVEYDGATFTVVNGMLAA